MIKEVTMYTVVCDNCGVDANDGSEYTCWGDRSSADDVAMDAQWARGEGNDSKSHYCPDCFSYDDNDNLVLKAVPPKETK